MKNAHVIKTALLVLVIALYVALRFWRLTDSCLWFDEIFSVHAAEHPWNTLLSFVALDLIHPPLFYVLLKLWITAGGESLFWLRLFPVVFAFVSLLPFILFLREMKQDRWVEIFAVFLLAVNGSLIKYTQEVRMYSPLLCFSLFSMWLFARYFVRGKSFVPLILINLLLVYTHYFGWFVVVSEIVAILIFQRIKWRRMLVMFAALSACFLPWVIAVWNAAHSGSELGQNIGWMTRPKPYDIFQFVLDLIEPIYFQATNIEPASIYRVSLPILLIVMTVFGLSFYRWKQQNEVNRQCMNLLVLIAVVPLTSAFVMSWILPLSIWGTRHLIMVFAVTIIVFAITVFDIVSSHAKVAVITLLALFSGYAFVLQATKPVSQYSWCSWETLIAESAHTRENIYTFEDAVAYYIWFAGRNRPANTVFKVTGIEIAEDKAYFLPRGFSDVATINFDEIYEAKISLVYRSKILDLNEPPLKNFLDKGYRIIDQRSLKANREAAILARLERSF